MGILERAVALDPAEAAYWYNLGRAQQSAGDIDESEASFRKALELDPQLLEAAHDLAVTLQLLDRSAEALIVIESAIRAGLGAFESKLLRGFLLSDVDRFDEAVDAYQAIVRENPGAPEAHEVLARLLPQVDETADPLITYEDALQRAPTLELYGSALKTAWDMKKAAPLERWSTQALRRFGDQPLFRLFQGLGRGLAGEAEGALELIEPLIGAGFTPALVHGAYYRLKLGDVRQAEAHALAATRASFADQSAWAYLTIIWRLLDDPREHWLADYDRLVMPKLLPPPEGFDDIGAFMGALAEELDELHGTLHHPADQSLREGTQTRGNLFEKRLPLVRRLSNVIEQSIAGTIADLPSDPTHPFLARNTGRTHFVGSWSVRLRSGGFHVTHIHQLGWLSSALYVALPSELEGSENSGTSPGSLAFGIPERELELDLPPRRVAVPQVGRLVLFPSYFWHGTMPFESDDYRLTVAFDAAPA